ncbi:MAG TPA: GNAT family N-acetyltransferase [Ktedonobacteraceae bacterium]|nr:GNAT family N-acetyltransferase [Ktedonobacteraceae bacterium]
MKIEIHKAYIPGAIGKIVELHGTYYAQHWRFGLFFEAKVATGLASFLNRYDESHDGFWVAVDGQRIVGSITIDGIEAAMQGAHLRWFILDPEYQGKGVGNQLMREAMRFCEEQNFQRVHLSTFAGLAEARHLYEKWGFQLVEEREGDTWGVFVREQEFEWARRL